MRLILFIVCCLIFSGCHQEDVKESTRTLTVLHTNDLHSHFLPSDEKYQDCDINSERCLGGYARIKTLSDTIRANNPNTLFLDAGDRFSGTVFYTMRKSEDLAPLTQMLNYDAITLGNHEFDDGTAELTKFLKNVSAMTVSANVHFSDGSFLDKRVVPSAIIYKNGLKIGIIGALSTETKSQCANAKDIAITNVIPAVQNEVNKLKNQGIDILIALTHIGIEEDKKLAKAIPELDIIVGAHSHTLLSNNQDDKNVYDTYPITVMHPDNTKTLITTVGLAGHHIGLLHVTFNKNGHILSYKGDAVRVDNSAQNNVKVSNIIQQAQQKISMLIDTPIAKNSQDIYLTNNGNFCSENCYIGEVLTDALLKTTQSDGADIALLNAGGIRAGFPQGNITLRHIASAYPFDSKGVLVKMTGQEILDYIEFGLKDYIPNDRTNAFLQIAGGQYTFDAVTKQVTSLTIAEKPVQSNASYFVILPSFLAEGGDGFPKKSVLKTYDAGIRSMIVETFKTMHTFKTFEKRIQKKSTH